MALFWHSASSVTSENFTCGFCGNLVAASTGWFAQEGRQGGAAAYIRICPHCGSPTFFRVNGGMFPKAPPGRPVQGAPPDVTRLYEEARRSAGANAPTAAVLVCRKILMHVAVEKGAEVGKSFLHYVE